ncbi:hypothetical protein BJX64DRAFT_123990 [Aspergillus heterothallicus]
MSTDARDNIPPYIDPSTVPIGRELGILFGFILTSLVIMTVYTVIWRSIERREEDRDRLRKERLIAQGVHHGRGGLHEKMLDQEVLRARAELPGHSTLGLRELGSGQAGVGERSRSHSRVGERERSIPRRCHGEDEVIRSRGGSRMREVL